MRRRRFLGTGASIVLAAVAGCIGEERPPSGPRTPPATPREEELTEEETDAPTESTDGDDSPDGETETTEPPGDLRVEELDFGKGTEGKLVVTVGVENVAAEERSGRLRVRAVIGDAEYSISRPVTVPGGESTTEEVVFDVEFDRFAADGIVDAEVSTEG
ncbi:MAG: hypothetical protein V5A46_10565 [Haloferacaceae archaeon]